MEWLRKWLDRRRVKALKKKVERLKLDAQEAELVPLMPVMETISRRIRLERLVVLERAVGEIDCRNSVFKARRRKELDEHAVTSI